MGLTRRAGCEARCERKKLNEGGEKRKRKEKKEEKKHTALARKQGGKEEKEEREERRKKQTTTHLARELESGVGKKLNMRETSGLGTWTEEEKACNLDLAGPRLFQASTAAQRAVNAALYQPEHKLQGFMTF